MHATGLLVTFFVVFVNFRGVRTTASGRFVSSHIAFEAGKDLVTGRIKGEDEEVGGIFFSYFFLNCAGCSGNIQNKCVDY